MLDDLLAAFQDDAPDPVLGLTCDMPLVRKSVADRRCHV